MKIIGMNFKSKRLKIRTRSFRVGFMGLAGFYVITMFQLSAQALTKPEADRIGDSLSQFYSNMIPEDFPAIDSSEQLEGYLAIAAKRSPIVRAAFHRWQAAMEKTGYVGALPNPAITYGYFIENAETRVGPQNQKFSLKQSFPWFGTLGARKQVSFDAANSDYKRYEAEKLKLFYRVKAAYYDYYFLGRNIALTRDNLELLKFWESVTRTKYKAALKKHSDVIKIQVELGKLEDHLLTLEHEAAPAAARLSAAINLPDSVTLAIPLTIQVEEKELERKKITQEILRNNPDLGALQHLIKKENSGVRLAGKSYFPNFTVGVDYIETGSALNPSSFESGKDPWVVGVGVSLPIWFGKNKSIRDEAVAKQKQAEYNYAEARNQLRALVQRVLFEYEDAIRKVRLYRDGLVPKAEQSLNANYTAYQAADLDFLNVLDAQRVLLDFELDLERAKADLAIRKAQIEMLMGIEINEKSN